MRPALSCTPQIRSGQHTCPCPCPCGMRRAGYIRYAHTPRPSSTGPRRDRACLCLGRWKRHVCLSKQAVPWIRRRCLRSWLSWRRCWRTGTPRWFSSTTSSRTGVAPRHDAVGREVTRWDPDAEYFTRLFFPCCLVVLSRLLVFPQERQIASDHVRLFLCRQQQASDRFSVAVESHTSTNTK